MKALLVTALLLAPLAGSAADLATSADTAKKASAAAKKDPRPAMHVFAAEITTLERFLLSEAEFGAGKNSKAILRSLRNLRRHVDGIKGKHGPFAGDPARRTNAAMLSRHLANTERTFRQGNKPFARTMLQSSLALCIACHTATKATWDFKLPNDLPGDASDLERANFLFATRQFDHGKDLYDRAIENYPGNKLDRVAIRKALSALAVYYVRVKEDPKGGAAYFAQVAKESWLSETDAKELKAWSEYLAAWSEEPKPTLNGPAAYLAEAQRVLGSDNLTLAGAGTGAEYVRRLRASALLHLALDAPGGASPEKGEALALLGRIYQRLNHQLFFRFGEMYLRACVQEYQKTKVAKICYDSLEEAITEGYTGSAGTKVPVAERRELKQLKALAY